MEPPKPRNSPRLGPEVVDRQSPKSERRRVRSWTVLNEIRGVVEQMTADAASRILASANPRDVRA